METVKKTIAAVIGMVVLAATAGADHQPHGQSHLPGHVDAIPGLFATPTITPTPTSTPTPSPTPTQIVFPVDAQFNRAAHFDGIVENGNGGASKAIDWTAGNYQSIVLDSTPTALTFTPPSGPCSVHLFLIQDAGGGKTVSWPSMKWVPGGLVPTLTTAGNAEDIVVLIWTGSTWYGMTGLDAK